MRAAAVLGALICVMASGPMAQAQQPGTCRQLLRNYEEMVAVQRRLLAEAQQERARLEADPELKQDPQIRAMALEQQDSTVRLLRESVGELEQDLPEKRRQFDKPGDECMRDGAP